MRFYNLLVAVLAAVTVTVAMRTVGLLLVSALMVVPVATAQQFTRGFRTTLLAAMAARHASPSVGGRDCVSAFADVPPGRDHRAARAGRLRAHLAARAGASRRRRLRRCRSRRRPTSGPTHAPSTERAPRTSTGPDCGHLAVEHGDHVDYVHDGHRHAAAREAL